MARHILLTYRFLEEDGHIAAFCDDLGLASCGSDLTEAKKCLEEAISTALNTMSKRGEVDAYLEEHGVPVHSKPEAMRTFSTFTMRPRETFMVGARELAAAGA